jgi:threonine synthase
MDHVLHLECLVCAKRYGVDDIDYVCPDHGPDGVVDVVYDYALLRGRVDRDRLAVHPDPTMFRYRELLPIEPDSPAPSLPVGGTPMWAVPGAGAPFGLEDLWIKDDGRNPTASLKDRASAVAVVRAREKGAAVVTTASTGNAAAALAGLAAATGQENVIFVPASAPEAKVAQLLAYGSRVFLVDGTYDDAYELCLAAADAFGWYNRSTGYNPYMSEGKKTAAYEIAETLGWRAPDAVVVSVGDGCIIGGLHKGFVDLHELGWTDRVPRLIGVQAQGSNYLAAAWEEGADPLTKAPIAADTVADSISAGLPRDRLKAMRAVVDTGGGFVTVGDDEILAAIPSLARRTGVFAEPAAAAAYAGLAGAVAEDLIDPDERVVVLATGSGLKDVAGAMVAVASSGARPRKVAPSLEALEEHLSALEHEEIT